MVIFWEIMQRFTYPHIVFYSRAIRDFTIPFWNPYYYSGTPFFASLRMGVLYPLNIAFAFFNYKIALTISIILHTFLAGVFMYFLMKYHFKTDDYSSILASIIYMFNGFFIFHLEIFNSFLSYVWFPVIFLFFLKALEFDIRYIILTSVFLTVQFFAGYPEFSFFTVLIIFIYLIWNIKYKKKHAFIQSLILFFVIIAFFIFLSSVQLLPTLEVFAHSERQSGFSYEFSVKYYSMNIKTILNYLFVPVWNSGLLKVEQDVQTSGFYFGILFPLLLILFIMDKSIKMKTKTCLIFLATLGFILSFGKFLPGYKILFYLLPWLRIFRFPVQHIFLVVVSFSIIAGLVAGSIREKYIKYVLVLIFSLDLLFFGEYSYNLISKSFFYEKKSNIEFLKKDDSLFRILHNPYTLRKLEGYFPSSYKECVKYEDTLIPNFSVIHQIYSADGLEVLRISEYEKFLNNMIFKQGVQSKIIDFLNVKYLISHLKITSNKWKLVKDGEYKIYENKTVLPRAFFIPDKDKTLNLNAGLSNYDISLRKPVLISEYKNNKILLNINAKENGWIFLSEIYYPGWYCYVDNFKKNIRKLNPIFRTVYVEKGNRQIAFLYNPLSFRIGLILSLFALIISLLLFIYHQDINKHLKNYINKLSISARNLDR
jgi:hypothetical protein